MGLSAARRTLVVVHVERGEHLRVISAREATRANGAAWKKGDPMKKEYTLGKARPNAYAKRIGDAGAQSS